MALAVVALIQRRVNIAVMRNAMPLASLPAGNASSK